MTESSLPNPPHAQNPQKPAYPPAPGNTSAASTPSTVVQASSHPGASVRQFNGSAAGKIPNLREFKVKGRPLKDRLAHISPCESQRYEIEFPHNRYDDEFDISPMTTDFYFDEHILPAGWVRFVHPDGYPFFFNETKKIVTNVDMCTSSSFYKDVEQIYQDIMAFWAEHYPQRDKWHLVLENWVNRKKEKKIGYYFVDYTRECIFWLDEYNARDMDDSVKIQPTRAHLGRLMKSQFWYHCEAYPNIYPVTDSLLKKVQDMLINALGDSLTSTNSTTPWGVKTLKDMLDLVNNMKVTTDEKPDSTAGTARVLFRFLAQFEHERFRNLYGEAGARLVLGQTIHEKPAKKKRTMLMKVLLPLFFFAPKEHLRRLEDITVDHLVNLKSWSELRERLTDDWKEHTLYATVLLNANVAFLAIQSVDNLGQSPPQQVSYVSVASSIGAIVMGLLLVKQHHTLDMKYLANRSVSSLGLETLSILYSLPYAFLMWGMITFFLAFMWMCFKKENELTTALMAISVSVVVMFLLWVISLYYEEEPYEHIWIFRKWHSFWDWFKSTRVNANSMAGTA